MKKLVVTQIKVLPTITDQFKYELQGPKGEFLGSDDRRYQDEQTAKEQGEAHVKAYQDVYRYKPKT